MTAFTLNRKDAVLLMIDIQSKLLPAIYGHDEIENNASRLLKSATTLGVPLLFTEQYPKGLGSTVDGISSLIPQESEYLSKTHFCCTLEPDFEKMLKDRNRSQVIVFGIESHICVLSTVLELLKRRMEVAVVEDGCGSRKRAHHELAMSAMANAGALIVPCESIIYQLLEKSGTPEFKELLPLFK